MISLMLKGGKTRIIEPNVKLKHNVRLTAQRNFNLIPREGSPRKNGKRKRLIKEELILETLKKFSRGRIMEEDAKKLKGKYSCRVDTVLKLS